MIRKSEATYFLGNNLYYNPLIVSQYDKWQVIKVNVIPMPENLYIRGIIVCPSGNILFVEGYNDELELYDECVLELGTHKLEIIIEAEGSKYSIPQRFEYEVVESLDNMKKDLFITLDLENCEANVEDGQQIYLGDTLELVLRANDGFIFTLDRLPYIKNGRTIRYFTIIDEGQSATLTTTVDSDILVLGIAKSKPVPVEYVKCTESNYVNCSGDINVGDLFVKSSDIDVVVVADNGFRFLDTSYVEFADGSKHYLNVENESLISDVLLNVEQDFKIYAIAENIPKPIRVETMLTRCSLESPLPEELYVGDMLEFTLIGEGNRYLADVVISVNGKIFKPSLDDNPSSYTFSQLIETEDDITITARTLRHPVVITGNLTDCTCNRRIGDTIYQDDIMDFVFTANTGYKFNTEPTVLVDGITHSAVISSDKYSAICSAVVIGRSVSINAIANNEGEYIPISYPKNTTLAIKNENGDVVKGIFPGEVAEITVMLDEGYVALDAPIIKYDQKQYSMDRNGEYYIRMDKFLGGSIVIEAVIKKPNEVVLTGTLDNCSSNYPIGHIFTVGNTVDFTLTANEGYEFSGTLPMLYENGEGYPFGVSADKLTATNRDWTIYEGTLEILAIAYKKEEFNVPVEPSK